MFLNHLLFPYCVRDRSISQPGTSEAPEPISAEEDEGLVCMLGPSGPPLGRVVHRPAFLGRAGLVLSPLPGLWAGGCRSRWLFLLVEGTVVLHSALMPTSGDANA